MKKKDSRSRRVSGAHRRCPKCGGQMLKGACTKCNYSSRTAYKSRREAKEYTFPAD